MKLSNFVQGLMILTAYYEGADGYHLGAEHDIIYAYPTDTPMGMEAVKRMIELGWFQSDFDGEDFTVNDYDPEDGWAAYV
jgi:hypothetical protein